MQLSDYKHPWRWFVKPFVRQLKSEQSGHVVDSALSSHFLSSWTRIKVRGLDYIKSSGKTHPFSLKDRRGRYWSSLSDECSPQVTSVINSAVGCHYFVPACGYLPSWRSSPTLAGTSLNCLPNRCTRMWTACLGLLRHHATIRRWLKYRGISVGNRASLHVSILAVHQWQRTLYCDGTVVLVLTGDRRTGRCDRICFVSDASNRTWRVRCRLLDRSRRISRLHCTLFTYLSALFPVIPVYDYRPVHRLPFWKPRIVLMPTLLRLIYTAALTEGRPRLRFAATASPAVQNADVNQTTEFCFLLAHRLEHTACRV